ncbi:glycoside hydrolase family 127 protein [Prevotella sp. 10(H)]|uniref:glycoside hydrolase family 127 protein n=1 Tax=Prevotella sp. 10(H) TaxID=1158294 RepID=UPI0004A6E121|nr:glycoside hydrolase family 127 protein [Prevotella sp. 10(H)]
MKIVIYIILTLLSLSVSAQKNIKAEYFQLQDIQLLDSPFKQAQELNRRYLLEMDADRLLAPFIREAGFPKKSESYTNWENTGLDGHIGGHYISALSLMYASTGDQQIKERLDYMISQLKQCQDANGNGYIGGVPDGKVIWDEIAVGNIRASGFGLNDRWVPLYNIHKTFAGLRDAYLIAGNQTAKEMLIKMADWAIRLVANLSEEQIQDMLMSEHGGLNETFADVTAITGDKKYLKLAYQFSDQSILMPLINHVDDLTGKHANTQIPKVLGFKRIADLESNDTWSEAARFFWETVVQKRSICIGGNSVREHFHPADDFSGMIKENEGPETCNTYNMLRLSKMFYQTSLDKKYIDYYERALYNHILSSQHPHNGGLVYFTQMRPGHYRVYSQPHTSMWCCVGSGIESHAKYGEMIYAHTDNQLYLNLFIPSRLNWKKKNIELIQENLFPDEANTKLIINPETATRFTLKVRYSSWVNQGDLKIKLNGKNYKVDLPVSDYISIDRKWKKGDVVEIEMPMKISVEQLPDKSNYYSIFYGPVALAAKAGQEDMRGLFADDSRGGHIANGRLLPLKDIPVIVSEPNNIGSLIKPVKGKPLTFTLSSLYSEKFPNRMELIPFFRLHESRYIIYWPQATVDEVEKLQAKIEREEKEREELDSITLDKVICGEQQPESDHFFQSEKSRTGFTEDMHWRDAEGWFSYEMKNNDKNAKCLYIKYFDMGQSAEFDIVVNEQKISSVKLENAGDNKILTSFIEIPENYIHEENMTVKFIAKEKKRTAKITEVRLLTDK